MQAARLCIIQVRIYVFFRIMRTSEGKIVEKDRKCAFSLKKCLLFLAISRKVRTFALGNGRKRYFVRAPASVPSRTFRFTWRDSSAG